jgi:hypothetical protein
VEIYTHVKISLNTSNKDEKDLFSGWHLELGELTTRNIKINQVL